MWYFSLSYSLILTYISIWDLKYLCFHAKFDAKIRTKFSSLLSSLPHINKTID